MSEIYEMNIDEIEKYIIGKKIKDMSLEEIRNFIEAQGNTIILNHHIFEKQQLEIERLNNIINKGKIYCEDVIQEHENGEYNVSTTQLAIEEHKKNIISLLNILNGDLENYWRSDKE